MVNQEKGLQSQQEKSNVANTIDRFRKVYKRYQPAAQARACLILACAAGWDWLAAALNRRRS
jgi:hypothetical protein